MPVHLITFNNEHPAFLELVIASWELHIEIRSEKLYSTIEMTCVPKYVSNIILQKEYKWHSNDISIKYEMQYCVIICGGLKCHSIKTYCNLFVFNFILPMLGVNFYFMDEYERNSMQCG